LSAPLTYAFLLHYTNIISNNHSPYFNKWRVKLLGMEGGWGTGIPNIRGPVKPKANVITNLIMRRHKSARFLCLFIKE
jgi:hypothetical protein